MNPLAKVYKVAVIPGDGIGKEVMPEGVRAVEAAGRKFGIEFKWDEFPWSCEYRAKHGRMMPEDGLATIRNHDAVFFGACGFPGVPDHVSLWELLVPMRRGFDLYVNLRPVRLMPGIQSPLAGRKQGDIDFWVVRENTEGEYSAIGGRIFEGTERESVVQQSTFTRHGTDRILKYAFELARSRPKKHLTSATKSNGISITMPYWDERVRAMAAQYPDVKTDQFHIDILTAHFVQHPDWLTWWWARTCSATSSRISGRRAPAPSASRPRAISTRSASFLRCSSRFTVRRPISTARTSPTPSARSGRAR